MQFHHGLGDSTQAAHLFSLWTRRGHSITVDCYTDKEAIFLSAGCEIGKTEAVHTWGVPQTLPAFTFQNHWAANKAGFNLDKHLPPLGLSQDQLWQELCDTYLDLEPYITQRDRDRVDSWLDRDNYILVCPMGNSNPPMKNLDASQQMCVIGGILDSTDCDVIIADWNSRTIRLPSYRVRHFEGYRPELGELYLLIQRARLVASVDTGTLHFARFTDTPCLGLWTGFHPAQFALPSVLQCNLCTGHPWNKFRRLAFNLVETGVNLASITKVVPEMLGERWASQGRGRRAVLAAMLDKLRQADGHLSPRVDRDAVFRITFDYLEDIQDPVCLSTGCIRQTEDWTAGYSTYVMGAFLEGHGGLLHSLDIDKTNIAIAKGIVADLPVAFHLGDSRETLKKWDQPLDWALLDSADTGTPDYIRICADEAKLVSAWLKPGAMLLIDDTVWCNGWTGKGTDAVPWCLAHGFVLVYSGYATLLRKEA